MAEFYSLPERDQALAEYVAAFVSGIPGWQNEGSSDPLYYIANYLISRGFDIAELNNRLAISLALGLASGADQDLLMLIPRLPGEADDAYYARQRDLLLNVSGFSNQRLEALLTKYPGVSDVGDRISSFNPTRQAFDVELPIQGYDDTTDPATPNVPPASTLLTAATNYMNTGIPEFWFAIFTCSTPTYFEYELSGDIIYDETLVKDYAQFRVDLETALNAIMLELRTIDGFVYDSNIYHRLQGRVDGIKDVRLTLTRWPAARAVLRNGEFVITDRGSGYLFAPTVTVTPDRGGTYKAVLGTGANAERLESITLTGGSGYTDQDTVTIEPPYRQATADAGILNGSVHTLDVTDAGAGYVDIPVIDISAPTGVSPVQATAIAIVSNGRLTGFSITDSGSGYLADPTVTIASPFTSAQATVHTHNGEVIGITFTNRGAGYVEIPGYTISGGGGTDAEIEFWIRRGHVVRYRIVHGGTGYADDPGTTITFDSPNSVGDMRSQPATVYQGSLKDRGWRVFYPSQLEQDIRSGALPKTYVTALATAILSGGGVHQITLTENGSSYLNVPQVNIQSPNIPAAATAFITSGRVDTIQLDQQGSGFIATPAVTIPAPPSGTQATATVQVSNGAVTGFTMTANGSGYGAIPTITVADGTGGIFTPIRDTVTGEIIRIDVIDGGSGYQDTSAVTIPAPAKTTATATAVIADHSIARFQITNQGAGYLVPPTITIADPTGTQATATASIDGGIVDIITVDDGGSGYAFVPSVRIDEP